MLAESEVAGVADEFVAGKGHADSTPGPRLGSPTVRIRLVEDDPGHIEGHSDRIRDLVLKTCFLRKA